LLVAFQERTTSNILQRYRWLSNQTGFLIEMNSSPKIPPEVTRHLRTLAHDLSNALETLLQASYLLNQASLDPDAKKWVQMIDSASQDATRINREIREILRGQSEA
jgi:hypothetical protein